MSKTNKYIIECKQTVTYRQEVELTKDEFNTLKKHNNGLGVSIHDGEAFQILEASIDYNDVFESEQEFEDFTIEKIK